MRRSLAATYTQIAAVQATNDALGNATKQEINRDSAAGVVLAGVEVGFIGQLVTQAQTATNVQQTSSNQQAAFQPLIPLSSPNQMSKDQFTSNLKELVAAARIGGQNGLGSLNGLWKADQDSLWGDSHKPGFDCDDFCLAMSSFLSRHFTKDSGCVMWFLTLKYEKYTFDSVTGQRVIDPTTGRAVTTGGGHQLLIVQRGSLYWVINATRGQVVGGSYATMVDVEAAATQLMTVTYNVVPGTIIYTQSYSRAQFQKQFPEEPLPWHTSPEMKSHFDGTLQGQTPPIDPKQFYPQDPIPPRLEPSDYDYGRATIGRKSTW